MQQNSASGIHSPLLEKPQAPKKLLEHWFKLSRAAYRHIYSFFTAIRAPSFLHIYTPTACSGLDKCAAQRPYLHKSKCTWLRDLGPLNVPELFETFSALYNKPPIPQLAIHFLPISLDESPLFISEHQRKAHGCAKNPSELNLLGSVCEIPLLQLDTFGNLATCLG
jgi:hypothetical protein